MTFIEHPSQHTKWNIFFSKRLSFLPGKRERGRERERERKAANLKESKEVYMGETEMEGIKVKVMLKNSNFKGPEI
jgi:hypothetical protein